MLQVFCDPTAILGGFGQANKKHVMFLVCMHYLVSNSCNLTYNNNNYFFSLDCHVQATPLSLNLQSTHLSTLFTDLQYWPAQRGKSVG